MDQLYPLAGTPTTSRASQDYDFLNYWIDQTVQKEIQRGKKLQELKKQPSVRTEKYDVINIASSNVYCQKKRSERRRKSPTKSTKSGRRSSPRRKNSANNRNSKQSRQRCPLRTAELAVPSKRQCFDTWRNKYHVLPGIMIDRLRQHVLDLSPIVKITDAIECFRIYKYSKRRKCKCTKAKETKRQNTLQNNNCDDQTIKKPTKKKERQYLCAIFGHKIAKQLIKPVTMSLNTELEKISNVVSIEIDKLINNGKRCNKGYIRNKKMHAEVAGKVSIWIANIMDETAYKILEDQLSDLEEEIGPVLDFMDDLIDNVVDICELEPEAIEVISSLDTYNVESSVDAVEYNYEEDIEQINEYKQQQENKEEEPSTIEDKISVNDNFSSDEELIEDNLDDKNELDYIINSFFRNIPTNTKDIAVADSEPEQNKISEIKDTVIHSFDGDLPTYSENIVFEDIAEFQLEPNETPEIIDNIDREQNKFLDAKDNFENDNNGSTTNTVAEIREDILKTAETIERTPIIDQKKDADIKAVPENYALIGIRLSEDGSNKKVKFSNVNIVTENEDAAEQGVFPKKSSGFINTDQEFYPPNYHLHSHADESWPENMTSTILRPSESVCKSITSLGKIMETKENNYVLLDDKRPKTQDEKNKAIKTITFDTEQNKDVNEKVTDRLVGNQQSNKESEFEGTNDTNELNEIEATVNDGTVDTKVLYEDNEKVSDGNIETKEKEIAKERTDQITTKDSHKIQTVMDNVSEEVCQRPSTDSTFYHHVPTDSVPFKNKLDIILEGKSTPAAVIVDKILGDEILLGVDNLDQILEDETTQEAAKFASQGSAELGKIEQEAIEGAAELDKILEGEATHKKLS